MYKTCVTKQFILIFRNVQTASYLQIEGLTVTKDSRFRLNLESLPRDITAQKDTDYNTLGQNKQVNLCTTFAFCRLVNYSSSLQNSGFKLFSLL